MTKVAINGAGRIGRAFLKASLNNPDIEVVAVNDLADIENISYLLKYDTVYGKSDFNVEVREGEKPSIVIDGKEVLFFSEKDPSQLPWKDLNIDVVVESTGAFTKFEQARVHIDAGAKKVVISAPAKDEPGENEATVLMGINDESLKTCSVTSNASCTTNAGSPLIQILNEEVGIEKAVLSTVHGMTASQSVVDSPNKKNPRLGRGAAQNIIPTSTGAAKATTKVITDLDGKFDGVAFRVPVPAGSIADITFIAKRSTTVEEINEILEKASNEERWKGIFGVTKEPLVSTDILGSTFGSIVDLELTRVIDGNLVKVCAWYDNETGYVSTLIEHVRRTGLSI